MLYETVYLHIFFQLNNENTSSFTHPLILLYLDIVKINHLKKKKTMYNNKLLYILNSSGLNTFSEEK
jgi:hypothetical protein